jgi:hypothetical protein
MTENEFIDSGIPSPRISNIRIGPNYHLEVTWAEGERAGRTDYVDLSPAINSYKVYRPLRNNESLFAIARLVDDGYAVEWGTHEIDMSADTLEILATESISPAEFADFLRRNNLTQRPEGAVNKATDQNQRISLNGIKRDHRQAPAMFSSRTRKC